MFKSLGRWWRKTQRETDLAILWPVCKEVSPSIGAAREVFYLHCCIDPAWFEDLSHEQIVTEIRKLS